MHLMKVLDLQCQHGHVFEGWFGSEDDFQSQKQRGLVQCPLCADIHIDKRLSAPRLNLGAREPAATPVASFVSHAAADTPVEASTLPPALQAAWLQLARKVVASTEDVGPRFADEARRMHHGEIQERAIRGQASHTDVRELIDEGIFVLPVPDEETQH